MPILKRLLNFSLLIFIFRSQNFNALYRNSRASVWSPPKSKRFVQDRSSCHDGPEPATYNPSDVDSIGGNYIVSKFKNLGIKRFVTPTQSLVNRLRIGKHGVSLTLIRDPWTWIIRSSKRFWNFRIKKRCRKRRRHSILH